MNVSLACLERSSGTSPIQRDQQSTLDLSDDGWHYFRPRSLKMYNLRIIHIGLYVSDVRHFEL